MRIAVVSDNCFAIGVYKHFNCEWTSPFVNTLIPAPDYIRLLKNLDAYLDADLQVVPFARSSRAAQHPRATWMLVLGGMEFEKVEVYIYHTKASGPWEIKNDFARRLARFRSIGRDNTIFKFGGVDDLHKTIEYEGFDQLLAEFHALGFKHKYSFTAKKHPYDTNFVLKEKHRLSSCELGLGVAEYFNIDEVLSCCPSAIGSIN